MTEDNAGLIAGESAPRRVTTGLVATVALWCASGVPPAWSADDSIRYMPGSGYALPSPAPAPTAPPAEGAEGAPAAPAPEVTHRISPQLDTPEFRPGWTVQPRVSIAEAFNDNVFQTSNDRKWDFITYITPGISVRGDTPRLQAALDYSPTAQIYARNSSQNSVGHNLAAYGLATVIEDTFFVDLRASAAVLPTTGGIGGSGAGISSPNFGGFSSGSGAGSGFASRNNQTQTFTATISPYYVHQFGDIGTFTAADRVSQSIYSARGTTNVSFPGEVSNSNLFSNEALLQFVTGSALGRAKGISLIDWTQFAGNGVVDGAYQVFVTQQLGYVVTRNVYVFTEFGYENIAYPKAVPKIEINDAVWAIGTTLTPDPDSTITVGYGHRYGFNAAFLNAVYMLTARTQIYARYQTGLGTDLQQLQGLVAVSGMDQYGLIVDSRTGAPLFLSTPGGFIQGNGTLNKTRVFSAGAIPLSTGIRSASISARPKTRPLQRRSGSIPAPTARLRAMCPGSTS